MQTKYFGEYIEKMNDMPAAVELVGTVKIHFYPTGSTKQHGVFLFVNNEDGTYKRYDVPQFMSKYRGQRVALLAREYTKQVGEKTYHKLIIISVRQISKPK